MSKKTTAFKEKLAEALAGLVRPGYPSLGNILRRRRQTFENYLASKNVNVDNVLDFLAALSKDQISYEADFAKALELYCDPMFEGQSDPKVVAALEEMLESDPLTSLVSKKKTKNKAGQPVSSIEESSDNDSERREEIPVD